jgi:hypothetical protein
MALLLVATTANASACANCMARSSGVVALHVAVVGVLLLVVLVVIRLGVM